MSGPLSSDPTFDGLVSLTLAASPVVAALLGVAFLVVSAVLILTVLIQRPQGGGLSGAFGAGGSGETAFGARTGDALTIATIAFFILWLVVAVSLVFATRPAGPVRGNPVATTPDAPAAATEVGTPVTGANAALELEAFEPEVVEPEPTPAEGGPVQPDAPGAGTDDAPTEAPVEAAPPPASADPDSASTDAPAGG